MSRGGNQRVYPLIVGYGRAGRELHHRCVRELARHGGGVSGEVVVVDPHEPSDLPPDARWMPTVAAAAEWLGPTSQAVGHVTTPVASHSGVVRELVAAGVARIIVEKPIAGSLREAEQLAEDTVGAQLLPVSVWPASAVTRRVEQLLAAGRIGVLRSLRFEQSKPRFSRSLAGSGARHAGDCELPHQLLLALHLAGHVREVTHARIWGMHTPHQVVPGMGGARVQLQHRSGVTSTLVTDFESPVRARRLRLTGGRGAVDAHFPISADENWGQVELAGAAAREVMEDAPLTSFMAHAYASFLGCGRPPRAGLDLHLQVMSLLERVTEMVDLTSEERCIQGAR